MHLCSRPYCTSVGRFSAWLTRGRLTAVSILSLLSTMFMLARQQYPSMVGTSSTALGIDGGGGGGGGGSGSRVLLTLRCCISASRTSPSLRNDKQNDVVQLGWYPYSASQDTMQTDLRMPRDRMPEEGGKQSATASDAVNVVVALGNGSIVEISPNSNDNRSRETLETLKQTDCRRRQQSSSVNRKWLNSSRRWLNRSDLNDEFHYNESSSSVRRRLQAEDSVNSTRRLPQCLIIGVRKGGTRALIEFLSLHPNVSAQKQEVHFFDDDFRYSRGLSWYKQQMRPSQPDQITIEKTPAYFVGPRVPLRVRRMNSSIKLLVIVRDPVERAISDYMQIHASRVSRGKYHASFERLVLDRRTGSVDRTYRAIWRSLYDRHMTRWLRHFRLKQFHIVDGDKLVHDPVSELRRVESFLGLEHRLEADMFYLNTTRGFYCMKTQLLSSNRSKVKLNASSSNDDVIVGGGSSGYIGGGKCLSSSKGRPHPDIDQQVINKLRQFFKPHNERFYRMVGVNLNWPIVVGPENRAVS